MEGRSPKAATVIGMGYVGLTMASVLAKNGYTVWGVDTNPAVVSSLRQRRAHIFEPGVADILKQYGGRTWYTSTRHRSSASIAIICVSTPVGANGRPKLSGLVTAARQLGGCMSPGCLVIVRSTVPIGTTRRVVLPELSRSGLSFSLAYCPERTIQGQGLREIVELPQIIGGVDSGSRDRAEAFFRELGVNVTPVSSLEAAEMVKLANNCHTDLIYSYGNEIAAIAGAYGLDPVEIIRAANHRYPRPDLSWPGFVGGPCLTKDPFLFAHSAVAGGYEPYLVLQARALNKLMPARFAEQLFSMMNEAGMSPKGARVLVCGIAYKGSPATDDTRGSPAISFIRKVRSRGGIVLGHDFVVKPSVIKALGGIPASLQQGFRGADAVVFLVNSPEYQKLDLLPLLAVAKRPLVYLDAWRIHEERRELMQTGIVYGGIEYVRRNHAHA